MNYVVIAFVLLPFSWRIFTDYKRGMTWAVFLLTALSAQPIIVTQGDLPNMTLQRLILIVFVVAAIKKNQLFHPRRSASFAWAFVFFAGVNLLPLIVSINPLMSVKVYFTFTLEIALFYIVIGTSIETKREARQVVRAGAMALIVVAILGLVERYTGFNPVDAFMPGYVRKPDYINDVLSTFPHRILFGTAMAMGWPLALAFAQTDEKRRFPWWIAVGLLLASCYLSFSRGPWIAAVFGGACMFFFAAASTRRGITVIFALVVFAMVLKPGVWDTITSRARETADVNSFKGQTYQYRWELWRIAWNKISHSGERLLFGFGQGATELMTFDAELSYTGETTKLWSWDNHYAATMMETGVVGICVFIWLYSFFVAKLFIGRGALSDGDKTLHASILAAAVAMLFMMTNVEMFAPQLNYLLWSLIPAGLKLREKDTEESYDNAVGL